MDTLGDSKAWILLKTNKGSPESFAMHAIRIPGVLIRHDCILEQMIDN
jgi:hypothetical protein